MKVGISFKAIFDTLGEALLAYGGHIDHHRSNGQDYYDFIVNGHIVGMDGETFECIHKSKEYWLFKNEDEEFFGLSNKEAALGTFEVPQDKHCEVDFFDTLLRHTCKGVIKSKFDRFNEWWKQDFPTDIFLDMSLEKERKECIELSEEEYEDLAMDLVHHTAPEIAEELYKCLKIGRDDLEDEEELLATIYDTLKDEMRAVLLTRTHNCPDCGKRYTADLEKDEESFFVRCPHCKEVVKYWTNPNP